MPRLEIRVQPGASRTRFAGWYGSVPKLAVSAPPVDGAANDAVVAALAKMLGLRPRQVTLVGGPASRTKVFEIEGLTARELSDRINLLNPLQRRSGPESQ
jgi:uncharacterized protein (TIGR00251 family)